MKRVIVSFSFLNKGESGELIPKPFVISKIKFANPLYAFGKVANFDPGNFATLPNAKMALANFNLLNLLSLNPSLPFFLKRGRGREPVPYISQHISQPLSTNWRRFRVWVSLHAYSISLDRDQFPLDQSLAIELWR